MVRNRGISLRGCWLKVIEDKKELNTSSRKESDSLKELNNRGLFGMKKTPTSNIYILQIE